MVVYGNKGYTRYGSVILNEDQWITTGRMTNMTSMLYQAKAGDGFRKKGVRRTNAFFNTLQEAVSEAFALKEKMDVTYKHEIQWDYTKEVTGSTSKMNILKGYLGGNKETKPFYLQIISVNSDETIDTNYSKKTKDLSDKDKKVLKKVVQFLEK